MTQLLIDGREAVLPKNFQTIVKRENSFFTKNGEYTYDCTLRMDNPVNLELYGFLHRLNKQDQIETNRTAVLIADGHVYCRGTEIVTRWTEQTVTIQIVSGESELNFFIGQDQKIDTLDLGNIGDNDAVWPLIRTGSGRFVNITLTEYQRGDATFHRVDWARQAPSPYLRVIINRLMSALGYTVGTNHLNDSLFSQLVIINRHRVTKMADTIPGWTVKEFLEEVEKLTGVVFVTDNVHKTCDIVQKTVFYMSAYQFTINNVIDAYETEVADDESRDAEFSTSDVSYDLPDGRWSKLMRLPDYLSGDVTTKEYGSFSALKRAADASSPSELTLYKDLSTGRTYIRTKRTMEDERMGEIVTTFLMEVDQFRDLDRADAESTLELKITPAPMTPTYYNRPGLEYIDLGDGDGFYDFHYNGAEEDEEETEEDQEPDSGKTFEDAIREAEKKESQAGDLYCAFFSGTLRNDFPQVYTDAYHAAMLPSLYDYERSYDVGSPVGSLRLKDLDEGYFQGSYEIDTRHAMTFETYDPNVIDPRQVYVIRNKRFVVRDVEETITAEGRAKKWKLTCYPIAVSDDALEKRWVLTHGVWDDGAAWLDDGRWNDNRR